MVNSSIRRRGDRERMKPKTAALLQKTSFQGEKYYYDKHKPSPKRRSTKKDNVISIDEYRKKLTNKDKKDNPKK